ncbi:Zn-ribbon domain-containing OB-fold protein [Rhodococcus sp. BP-252]|uniref:Zn-ribbon domain-containing OB-fold protein n=1 Tax=unclassified Rhodococcus (in: high G+C Gram-positive bacteria) TaxID=192944 RepID=UPI00142FD298|nr:MULTISPECIES: Zn-ribbon domain-containing OB-fold protein [unclassified Rhodococcus (in: high G+C Gram-positive bacteria)]MBY6410843.1 Zn-ribbon domain-containing OB-fold protein [Rhodococcus sp. BP-320]MBY6415332.1 Zn-ribbon domain-containing OB-fold protein [Rhodococcus sp. BP-321]MBY6419947.1 Zn-ribbon domain-containing OB-fold protein [Rhodococcus sp. BP-324]MBY6425399.1 Zn-ribbon domain-containing OB-fold protein [Rhodococcus sp. BP-323]MBY6430538.1 Zn-ribbon domain-containing OB-fold 
MTSSTVPSSAEVKPKKTLRKLAPKPTPETAFYWAEAAAERLVVQRCLDCRTAYFYPRDFCPACNSGNVEWIECSGRASLYSYVIEHRPGPGFEDEGPYVVAVVELEEGPRMMTNIVGVEPDPDLLPLDLDLVVRFEERGDMKVPVFGPAGSAS